MRANRKQHPAPRQMSSFQDLVPSENWVLPDGRRGRGTLSNDAGRFEALRRSPLDDGWDGLDLPQAQLRTQVIEDTSRSILARNDSPDVPFDRSVNPYRGCEHGCTYCFARPTHAYLGYSPGLDFESKILFKPNATALLKRELAKKTYVCKPIAMGTNTDPYQPIEKRLKITRSILEVLWKANHPVSIVTKSALITRDVDILSDMAKKNLVKVAISVTSLDRYLSRVMEPRAATPERRFEALKILTEAGVKTAVMVAPVIPGLNASEMEKILQKAHSVGVTGAGYILLRLPLEVRDLFYEWLDENFPDRAKRVRSLIQQTRDGKDYDAEWGKRMRGSGPFADMIERRFRLALSKLDMSPLERREASGYLGTLQSEGDHHMTGLDCSRFKRPILPGQQLELF